MKIVGISTYDAFEAVCCRDLFIERDGSNWILTQTYYGYEARRIIDGKIDWASRHPVIREANASNIKEYFHNQTIAQ